MMAQPHATNAMRHAPTKYQLKAMRIGRMAADADRPLVLTTRVGLMPGKIYMSPTSGLTQVLPTTGDLLEVGVAISATSMEVTLGLYIQQ